MSFLWPIAFLLLVPLGLWWFLRPYPNRRVNLLRALLYGALVLLLTSPMLRLPDRAGVAVVLADRSRSMPGDAEGKTLALIRRLESARPPDSRLGVVSFAGETMIEKLPAAPPLETFASLPPAPDATDPERGLAAALSLIPADAPGRILLVSDGDWTLGDPSRLFATAAARGIAIDYHHLRREAVGDLAIAGCSAPLQASRGAWYTIHCRVLSPAAQTATCRIRRGDGAWQSRSMQLARGMNELSWRDRGETPGILDYTIEVAGDEALPDPIPENNRARLLVEISGRKPLLLLTNSPSGNLARVLRDAKFEVVALPPAPRELAAGKLAGYAGVILENVPASSLSLEGMQNLAALVKAGSLGLLMTGGRHAFAVGGYYRSPIEELLPVSLEQRQEIRKSTLALMITLDRSGSMAAPIGGMTKMDMANLAAIEVLKLLQPNDEFGLHAVDSQVHKVVPLNKVGELEGATQKIRRIESMGGGIFTCTALREALKELEGSKASTRHLILFADAADAEEPGNYQELLARAEKQGITVSVVGLGTKQDSDAVFLIDIAKRGKGEVYFSDRAEELPRIFAQDTFLVARSTFIDTPTAADYTQALRSLTAVDLGRSTEFGGYNLCYAKAGSETVLMSRDEFTAPIAALGQAGLGRAAALAAEADGEFTGAFARDPHAGSLLAALAGWMLTPEPAEGDYLITEELRGGAIRLEIHLDPDRNGDPWRTSPEARFTVARPGEEPVSRRERFEWASPDRLECVLPLEREAVYLPTVVIEGKRPQPLAPVTLPYSPEFRPHEEELTGPTLEELCRSTGGRERFTPEEMWRELPSRPRQYDLAPALAVLASLLLLLEVLERRTGLLALLRLPERAPRETVKRPPRRRQKNPIITETAPPPPPLEAPPPEEEDELTQALRRARRR